MPTQGPQANVGAVYNGWPQRISTEERLNHNVSNSSSTEVVYFDDYSLLSGRC